MSSYTARLLLEPSHTAETAIVRGGFRYYIGELGSNEYIDIEDGFETDGITLPPFISFFLRPFVPRWQYAKAVVVHDKLCKTRNINHLPYDGSQLFVGRYIPRNNIDLEFKTALMALGCPWLKAQAYYLGVRAWFYLNKFKTVFKSLLKGQQRKGSK